MTRNGKDRIKDRISIVAAGGLVLAGPSGLTHPLRAGLALRIAASIAPTGFGDQPKGAAASWTPPQCQLRVSEQYRRAPNELRRADIARSTRVFEATDGFR